MYEMMKTKFYDFITLYKDFRSGKIHEEEMTRVCTQPFWQSLMHSKRRFDENGLVMDLRYEDEKNGKKRGNFSKTEAINVDRIETEIYPKRSTYKAGFAKKRLTVKKRILKDGSCIYEENADMMVCTDQIMKDGEDAYIECPNCGHIDTISSFISGCSHCSSKFHIQENELKISSFYMKNDYEKGIARKFGAMAKIAGLIFVISLISTIAFCLTSLVMYIINSDLNEIIEGIGSLIYMSVFALLLSGAFWLCLVIVNILRWIYYDNHMFVRINYSPVTREIREKIKDFSTEVFAQNLEMILRNIHMTNSVDEVSVYTNMDASELVKGYSDVIDCSLNDITFLKFKKVNDDYVMTVDVGMDVLRYKDGAIRHQYEEIALTLSAAKDMVMDNISVVSMYKCESCGSTVNLLNGGVCEYCESKIPYNKYNFILENYRIKDEAEAKERKIRRKLIVVFVVMYSLAAWGIIKLMM